MTAGFKKHDIVDFYDDKRIAVGLILELDEKRLRLLTDVGRETKISPSRILTAVTDSSFPISSARDVQVAEIKAIAALREAAKSDVDLHELWEVVSQDADKADVEDLADLMYGRSKDMHSAAALLRAIYDDKVYFKIKSDHIEISSPDRVEQTLIQRGKEEEKRRFMADCADFIVKSRSGPDADVSDAPPGLIELLEEAAFAGNDWMNAKPVKTIFSMAGIMGETDPFRLLVDFGVWKRDENVRLKAEKVPITFDSEIESEAEAAAARSLGDLGGERITDRTIAIDAKTTRDVDDALSLRSVGGDLIVGVHITDAAHFVEYDSTLDRHIRERGTSVYMPDLVIPMMPPSLSEQAASLCVGKDRPAVTVEARLAEDKTVKDFRIFPSIINLDERLSYEETDERVESGHSPESELFEIAIALRNQRTASGAIIFRDPELAVRINDKGEIEVSVRDKETPSQVLVSEMMILANRLFAAFMRDNRLPAIYRSQPRPTERIDLGDVYDPVASYKAKKVMARGDIGPEPAPHATLGLECYTTATSPLRRYPDLVVQRQIKSFLESGTPLLSEQDIENMLLAVSYPLERAAILERERQRYYLLTYLTRKKDQELATTVLHRFPKFYLVRIEDLSVNAALPCSNGLTLQPYDKVIAKINKINPRADKLVLSPVRLL